MADVTLYGTDTTGAAVQLTMAQAITALVAGGGIIPGASFLTGAGVPGAGVGVDGDTYMNSTTGDVYGPKSSGAWGAIVASLHGAAGTSILSGVVPPVDLTDGSDGDFFINTATSTLYGPKAAGAWPVGVSLIGAAGGAGEGFLIGAGVPAGGLGVDGDVYLDTDAGRIYGAKAAGVWGAGTLLVVDPSAILGNAATGLGVKRSVVAVFDVGGGKVIGNYDFGALLPNNAIVTKVYINVVTSFTSATNAATVDVGRAAPADIHGAMTCATLTAPAILDGVPANTAATVVPPIGGPFGFNARVVGEDLITGKLEVIAEYV